jgi:hypothetical protein
MIFFVTLFFHAQAQPYLKAKNVETVILREKELFPECASLQDGLHTVRFSIDNAGVAQLRSGESCFSGIQTLSFPAHPTTIRTFSWEVASKEGVLYPQRLLREKSTEILLPGIFAIEKKKLLDVIQKEGE